MPLVWRRRIRSALHTALALGTGATVTVCSSGSDEDSGPRISLSQTTPEFTAVTGGADPTPQVITITNSGSGTLTGLAVGTITYGAGAANWLQPPVLGSTTADPTTTIALQPVTGSLAPGTYTATVPVLSDVASNSPRNLAVTFTVVLPCAGVAYTIGTTVDATLSQGDCVLSDSSFFDAYSFTATANASVRFNLSSNAFDAFLLLADPAGTVLAFNDDGPAGTNSTFRVLLGSGPFQILANSFDPKVTGDYSLNSSVVPSDVAACEEVWVTPGVNTAQAIETTDCLDDSGPFYHDEYLMRISTGQTVTLTHKSTDFDSFLLLARLQGGNALVVATDDNSGGGTDSKITYTNNDTPAFFVIVAATNLANKTGGYTLTVE